MGYRSTEEEAQKLAKIMAEGYAKRWQGKTSKANVVEDKNNHNGSWWLVKDDNNVTVRSFAVYPLEEGQ